MRVAQCLILVVAQCALVLVLMHAYTRVRRPRRGHAPPQDGRRSRWARTGGLTSSFRSFGRRFVGSTGSIVEHPRPPPVNINWPPPWIENFTLPEHCSATQPCHILVEVRSFIGNEEFRCPSNRTDTVPKSTGQNCARQTRYATRTAVQSTITAHSPHSMQPTRTHSMQPTRTAHLTGGTRPD